MALGTDKLPSLFLASLFLTFFAAPLASNYLHRHQERAVQRLFRGLALGVLGAWRAWLLRQSSVAAAVSATFWRPPLTAAPPHLQLRLPRLCGSVHSRRNPAASRSR